MAQTVVSGLVDVETMLQRMCSEYLEMPGLHLTCRQAQRLWGIDEATCQELLRMLLEVGFLRRTRAGTFARTSDGPAPRPSLRMAKASLEIQNRHREQHEQHRDDNHPHVRVDDEARRGRRHN